MSDLEKVVPGKEVLHILGTVTDIVLDFKDPEGKTWIEHQQAQQKASELNERMWELYKQFKGITDFKERFDFLEVHGTFNHSKVYSMSKRRQKRFLAKQFGFYYHAESERLVPMYRRFGKGILLLNPVFKFEEPLDKPFVKMMEAWAGILVGEQD